MKNLTATICLTISVLLGSVGVSYAVTPCPEGERAYWHNCYGTYTDANGNKYVGEFRDQKRHGQGTMTYAKTGNKYVGEWKENRNEGFGVFTDKDGTIYSGNFSKEYPGKWGKHGNGKIVFLDGRRFEGRWINNYPSDGILTGRTGKKISLDYGWDRGKFRGGRLYKIIISFEGGAKFIGEIDRRYNPTKGEFIDKFGKKIDAKKFADFFRVSSFAGALWSADFQKGLTAADKGDFALIRQFLDYEIQSTFKESAWFLIPTNPRNQAPTWLKCSKENSRAFIAIRDGPVGGVSSYNIIGVLNNRIVFIGGYQEGNGYRPYYWNPIGIHSFKEGLPENLRSSDAWKNYAGPDGDTSLTVDGRVVYTEFGMLFIGMGKMFWYSDNREFANVFGYFFDEQYCDRDWHGFYVNSNDVEKGRR
jgi:hypothetical protein